MPKGRAATPTLFVLEHLTGDKKYMDKRKQEVAIVPTSTDGRLANRADRHPAVTYLARLGKGSQRTMREALNTVADIASGGKSDSLSFDWAHLRYEHTAALRRKLSERYAASTANKMLSALRGVLRDAWRLKLMSAEDFQRAVDLPPVRGEPEPRGRALTAGELMALFRVCTEDTSPAGARDAAALALLYGAGLRRAELVALDVRDFDRKTGALAVRRGKGRRPRLVYASNGAFNALEDWLRTCGGREGPLFVRVNKAGAIEHRRITPQAIYIALKKRGKQAGLEDLSPHDLRRTFISDLLDSGADVSTVKALAGHAQINTTVRYDRRGERAKQQAAELLAVPYRKRREGDDA